MEKTRYEVLKSFSDEGEYSHVIPARIENYIDGMFHIGMLAVAATIVRDNEVANKACEWLQKLPQGARNWAVRQPASDWVLMGGKWCKMKPQSFAGPCAVEWARSVGAHVKQQSHQVHDTAKLLRLVAWPYGVAIRYIKPLRQHLSSVMLAHLLTGKTPPDTLKFAAKKNPLYSYQFGILNFSEYPENAGPWPAKNVWGYPQKEKIYTPICQLVADYLQKDLALKTLKI